MHAEDVLAVNIPLATTDSALVSDVLDASDCGLVVLDEDTLVIQWNTWMTACAGIGREQTLDSSLPKLFPKVAGARLARQTIKP